MKHYAPARMRRRPLETVTGFRVDLPQSAIDLFAADELTSHDLDTREPPTCECGAAVYRDGRCVACNADHLRELVAYHRAEAAKFTAKEADDSERDGSKYIVGVADWHGKLLPAVLNTETGLTSAPMSRTLAQRRCSALNYHERTKTEGAAMHVDCDDAKLLRQLHGVGPAERRA